MGVRGGRRSLMAPEGLYEFLTDFSRKEGGAGSYDHMLIRAGLSWHLGYQSLGLLRAPPPRPCSVPSALCCPGFDRPVEPLHRGRKRTGGPGCT